MSLRTIPCIVGKLFYDSIPKFFKVDNIELSVGNICVVHTEFGLDLAKVLKKFNLAEEKAKQIGTVVRLATRDDFENHKKNEMEVQPVFEFCIEKVKELRLPIKIVKPHYTLDRSKLLIFFMSQTRVDFREFVKQTNQRFNIRCEMRQLSPREETAFIGGFGICGREYCCIKVGRIYDNISIKMAKVQKVDVYTSKIIGPCGKLLCCLAYEYENYVKKLNI